MNGSSTRIFQNVRYDLVLNDDNPNDYYFEPTGVDIKNLRKKMLPAGNKNDKKGAKVKDYKEKEAADYKKKLDEERDKEADEKGDAKETGSIFSKRGVKNRISNAGRARKKFGRSITNAGKALGKAGGKAFKSAKDEARGVAKDQLAISYKEDLEKFSEFLTKINYDRPAKAKQQMSKLLKRGKWGSDPSVKWSKIEKEIKDMDAKELKNYLSRETSFLARKGRQAKATGGAGASVIKGARSLGYNAIKGTAKSINEGTKKGSLGVVRKGIGAAGSKAFKGGKAIGKYAKGITTAQNNYNNVKIKSKHVEGLSEIEKFEKEKLREKVKEIKMLEKIIFKLSGQPSATRKRLNKLAKGASKGLKIAGKGLFKLGKKGIGFLNKIPGSKVGFGSSMRSIGKGFKMGSKGARAGIKRLKTFGGFASKGAGAGIRRLKTIGGGGAKLALKGVKAASKAAAATAAAIAAKTKTPVNDEPGLVCWNFTNLPPCLCLKIFAPVLCCTFLTEEKAKEQAKRLT